MYLKFKANPSAYNHYVYKSYRNRLNSVIRQAEKDYYHDELQRNRSNMRKSWDILKSIINKRQLKPNNKFIVNNQQITDPLRIANSFNNYFVNIGANLSKNIPVSDIDPLQYVNVLNFPKVQFPCILL